MGRKQTVRIDICLHVTPEEARIVQEFKNYVLGKYGKGGISREVPKALKRYLEAEKEADSVFDDKKIEIYKRVDVKEKLKYFWTKWFEKYGSTLTISSLIIIDELKRILGFRDPRTVRKYLNIMVREGLIVPQGPVARFFSGIKGKRRKGTACKISLERIKDLYHVHPPGGVEGG